MIRNTKEPTTPYKIGFLLLEGFALMSFSAVVEPLRAANLIAKKELYEIDYFSTENKSTENNQHKALAER